MDKIMYLLLRDIQYITAKSSKLFTKLLTLLLCHLVLQVVYSQDKVGRERFWLSCTLD